MNLGIIIGRLTKVKKKNELQFFPDDWKKDLLNARKIGFNKIQWLIVGDDNPLFNNYPEVYSFTKTNDIQIESALFHNYLSLNSKDINNSLIEKLKGQIDFLFQKEIKRIIFPIKYKNKIVLNFYNEIKKKCEYRNKKILLEADNLNKFIPKAIKFINNLYICYDLGNNFSKNNNLVKDILNYEKYIKEIHIKDKKLNMNDNVYLGHGGVNFKEIKKSKSNLPFIFEVKRTYDPMTEIIKQRNFFLNK